LLALSEWPYKTENSRIPGTGTEGSNLSLSAKESAISEILRWVHRDPRSARRLDVRFLIPPPLPNDRSDDLLYRQSTAPRQLIIGLDSMQWDLLLKWAGVGSLQPTGAGFYPATSNLPTMGSFEREVAFGIAATVKWADNTHSRIQS